MLYSDCASALKEGLTALHYAADGRPDVARELLDLKAKVDIPTKVWHESYIHCSHPNGIYCQSFQMFIWMKYVKNRNFFYI